MVGDKFIAICKSEEEYRELLQNHRLKDADLSSRSLKLTDQKIKLFCGKILQVVETKFTFQDKTYVTFKVKNTKESMSKGFVQELLTYKQAAHRGLVQYVM